MRRYKDVTVAEDGSVVEIHMADRKSLRIKSSDLKELIEDLIRAMTACRLSETRQEPPSPTMQAVPPTVLADDVNVNWIADSDCFAVEASDRQKRRVIAVLREDHVRFLIDVHRKTRGNQQQH